ncbi:MAG TPA: nitrous oxide reductase family maturation protein NosD [Blastocatellia bacterium]|nr:nitrous oxide reductase family maturation protein NosD [Blastocatellia bacterium]
MACPPKIGLVLVFLGLVSAAHPAQAAVLTVGDHGEYRTIAEAVAAASPSDVVRVLPGTYYGNIVIDKSLSVEGIGKPMLHGTGTGSVLTITADACQLRGFLIEHCGGDLQQEDAGILIKSQNNVIENNELRDILYGVYLYSSHGNTIRGNSVYGRTALESGDRGAGLHLWNSPDNTLEDNSIYDARDGLYIQSCAGNTILRNRVYRVRYGLHYMFSNDNRIEDNLFSNNVAGAAIMYSNNITLRNNAFVHNRGFSSFGILFQECNDCTLEGNFIIDNATGMFMEAVRRTIFRRNVIAENDTALEMFTSSDENTFTENNFVENLSPLRLIGRRTTTHWQNEGHGNYWSDYDGYDLDGDGVGDRPHEIQNVFEYLEGNYPRLRLYLNSPAAQALAAAEKAFPLIQSSRETDRSPLMKAIPIKYSFEAQEANGRARWLVALTSILMTISASIVFVKFRRIAN